MNDLPDIKKIEQRTLRDWFQDGLQEIFFGAFTLILGIYFFLLSTETPYSSAEFKRLLLFFPFCFISLLIVRKIYWRLREKYVDPRTGYVRFQKDGFSKNTLRILPMNIGVVILYFITNKIIAEPIVIGMILMLSMFYSAAKARLPRLAVLALITGILSVVISRISWNSTRRFAVFMLIISIPFAINGSITFFRFLRRNPLPAEDQR